MKTFHCTHCHQDKPVNTDGITSGYGVKPNGDKVCFSCCGEIDRAEMIERGRATMYLCKVALPPEGNEASGFAHAGVRYYLKNWPGTLSIPVSYLKTGRHNIARKRYDAWFTGPDGKHWHAVQYGDNTQIAHCRRLAK